MESSKLPEALKSKHLKAGIKPIMACVGSFDDDNYDSKERVFLSESFNSELGSATNVNWKTTPQEQTRIGLLNPGTGSYVISPIDHSKKYSFDFCNCTGLIVCGIDKKTGEEISFMSHQEPNQILVEDKEKFNEHLALRLSEIARRCEPGTIDAVIVGGNYIGTKNFNEKLAVYQPEVRAEEARESREVYLSSIKLVSEKAREFLGFEPIIINGPKTILNSDNVYYDTKHRRIYFLREKVNQDTRDFSVSGIDAEEDKWAA